MSGFDRRFQNVLGGVVTAARAALRDLEVDDIPPRLRKVAQASGRRLPPPLASSLLAEVDRSVWLRDKTQQAFESSGVEDLVADAFLRRDEGWWVTVAGSVLDRAAADTDRDRIDRETTIADLREELSAAKARGKEAAAAVRDAEKAARAGRDTDRSSLRDAARRHQQRAEIAASEAEDALNQLAAIRDELIEVERSRADLYRRFRAVRAERSALQRRVVSGDDSWSRDAASTARMLDRIAATLAPFREAEALTSGSTSDTFVPTLPAGIAPDAAAAVESLGDLGIDVILVDGHNLLGSLDETTMGDPDARRDLITSLGRLKRKISSAAVIVVFDSALGGGREKFRSTGGVDVEFSPPAETADDVLVERAAASVGGVVVVSNDREVRERAAAAGALPVWADALARWLGSS